jgi:CRISPR-associated endoribonuclease Cas6
MKLESDAEIDGAIGPALQGFIMEMVSESYVDALHSLAFNPYSQYLTSGEAGSYTWVVNALDDVAAVNLLEPLRGVESIDLKALKGHPLRVKETSETQVDPKEWTRAFYSGAPLRKARCLFLTPTAFKQAGRYVFHPDLRLFFQNLQLRHSVFSGDEAEPDEALLEEIVKHTRVTSYQLRSRTFSVHGTRIPGFTGFVTLGISGAASLASYLHLLLRFGEYSGVGMKTSMGMGAFRYHAITKEPIDAA